MFRRDHFRGRLSDGDHVLLDSVEGYLGCQEKKDGRKTWFGHLELRDDQRNAINPGVRYRLTLEDGRNGEVYLDLIDGNKEGMQIAEFQVTGGFRDRRGRT